MLRSTILATAVVLTLSVAALGARFTMIFDPIEVNVQALQDQLPDKLDKSQKKAAKAYKSVLKKLGKDTPDLAKELKLGKSLAGKLSKLGDPQIDGLMLNASDQLQGRVLMALGSVQERLGSVMAKATPAKVQKQLDAGYAQMEAAAADVKLKKRFARYGAAEARARKAEKLLNKLTGGGSCDGQAIGFEDSVQIARNGDLFGADKYSVGLQVDGTLTRNLLTFSDCDGNVVLRVFFPETIAVGDYSGGSLDPAAAVGFAAGPADGNGFGIGGFGGNATVTNVDGRLQFSFSWDTGDIGSDFDGLYDGMIDLPAITN